MVKISVLDSGIGISAEDQENLFQPFFKSKDQNSVQLNPNGNGLGLYISRQICDAAGGSLEVFSQHMVGSNFKFTMQVTPALPNETLYERPSSSSKHGTSFIETINKSIVVSPLLRQSTLRCRDSEPEEK